MDNKLPSLKAAANAELKRQAEATPETEDQAIAEKPEVYNKNVGEKYEVMFTVPYDGEQNGEALHGRIVTITGIPTTTLNEAGVEIVGESNAGGMPSPGLREVKTDDGKLEQSGILNVRHLIPVDPDIVKSEDSVKEIPSAGKKTDTSSESYGDQVISQERDMADMDVKWQATNNMPKKAMDDTMEQPRGSINGYSLPEGTAVMWADPGSALTNTGKVLAYSGTPITEGGKAQYKIEVTESSDPSIDVGSVVFRDIDTVQRIATMDYIMARVASGMERNRLEATIEQDIARKAELEGNKERLYILGKLLDK